MCLALHSYVYWLRSIGVKAVLVPCRSPRYRYGLLGCSLSKRVLSGASVATQISEPLLRIDAAAKTPVTPSVLGFSRSALTRLRLLPANAMQLSLELLCSVPTQLNAALQEKWVNGEGHLSVLSRRMGLDPLFRAPLTP